MNYVIDNCKDYMDSWGDMSTFLFDLYNRLDNFEPIEDTRTRFKCMFGTENIKYEVTHTFPNKTVYVPFYEGSVPLKLYVTTEIIAHVYGVNSDSEEIELIRLVKLPIKEKYANAYFNIAFNLNTLCYNGQTFVFNNQEVWIDVNGDNDQEYDYETEFPYTDDIKTIEYGCYEIIKDNEFYYYLNKLDDDGTVIQKGDYVYPRESKRDFRDFDTTFYETSSIRFEYLEGEETRTDYIESGYIFEYGCVFSPERVVFTDKPEDGDKPLLFYNVMNLNGTSIIMLLSKVKFRPIA